MPFGSRRHGAGIRRSAYQALIPSLVGEETLQNAIALNSIQFNMARVLGPVFGGIALDSLGAAWCFGLNGFSFLAVIASLLSIQVRFVPAKTTDSVMASMKEGLKVIRMRPGMTGLIVLAFGLTLLSYPLSTFLPVFAKDIFHGSSMTFTMLLSTYGAGSVIGALLVAGARNQKGNGRNALLVMIMLGALISMFAVSRNLVISMVVLFRPRYCADYCVCAEFIAGPDLCDGCVAGTGAECLQRRVPGRHADRERAVRCSDQANVRACDHCGERRSGMRLRPVFPGSGTQGRKDVNVPRQTGFAQC